MPRPVSPGPALFMSSSEIKSYNEQQMPVSLSKASWLQHTLPFPIKLDWYIMSPI